MPLTRDEERICCPGAGDNTACAAILLLYLKYARQALEQSPKPLLFAFNSCEEGLGNLKGIRRIMETYGDRIQEATAFDGGVSGVCREAVGSLRYQVTIRTRGGHSFNDFGNASAVEAMTDLIQRLYRMPLPEVGKNTYNVGTIQGGTSVNSIPQSCTCLLEYRSDCRESLAAMKNNFQQVLHHFRQQRSGLHMEMSLMGERPCSGRVNRDAMEELVQRKSLTEECKEDLCALTECGYNIFISGGTSSGKTTMLNALASYIHPEERVVIIEDSAELQLNHLENRVQMECRSANSIGKGEVRMDQLIRTSLRMRPDRIIVGEVRGGEVLDMIQAMNTGHSGSISTGHGNSIRGMLNRLETMYMMGAQVPVYTVRNQIANAIEIFVHLKRDGDGNRRVMEVAELAGFDGKEYNINYLYRIDGAGELVRTGNALLHRDNLKRGGMNDRL